jgi:fructose-specific phosphotransferase system IIC component
MRRVEGQRLNNVLANTLPTFLNAFISGLLTGWVVTLVSAIKKRTKDFLKSIQPAKTGNLKS